MKKLLFLFIYIFGVITVINSQTNTDEIMSFGRGNYFKYALDKPAVRYVNGGTRILIDYEGDIWNKDLDRKHAFEHACLILEEYLPTTVPIRIKVSFETIRTENAVARTSIYTDPNERFNRAYVKRRLLTYGDVEVNNMNYFSEFDGKIAFSDADIFSYTLDFVTESKYDFVTVSLRELAKIFGFYFSLTGNSTTKTLSIYPDLLTVYDRMMIPYEMWNNPSAAYTYATSGNVVKSWGGYQNYKFYAPSVFENGVSLSYFAVDANNKETRLLQPELPKGTSIRYVGDGLVDYFEHNGWDWPLLVGMGSSPGEADSGSTNDVKEYNKPISFGSGSYRAPQKETTQNDETQLPVIQKASLSSPVQSYVEQFGPYCKGKGWYVGVLLKDGTWVYPYYTSATVLPSIEFDPKTIDASLRDQYARSSDGYLRCRVTYDDGISYNIHYPSQSYSKYFLLDYLPQKPQAAFSKVLTTSGARSVKTVSASGSYDFERDIKISFKNVEGTERILVEQLEEGARNPFTYYVDNIKDGYFIATVDKDYSTTFRLRAQNANGETISEWLYVAPVGDTWNGKYIIKPRPLPDGSEIKVSFEYENGVVAEHKIAEGYEIYNATNPIVSQRGNVLDNTIRTENLQKGIYTLKVTDSESNVYVAKVVL